MSKSLDFSKIRLICSDIDGTLLRGEKELPTYIKDEIWRLHKNGILFTFATGRLPYEVDHLFCGLPQKTPYVAGNGAVIKEGDTILEEKFFLAEPLREIAQKYSALGMTVIFSYEDGERPLEVTPWAQKAASMFPGLDTPAEPNIWERKLQRMFFLHPQGEYLANCRKDLEQYGDLFDICSQNDQSVQIAPLGCTKAAGVARLAALLGLNPEQVMCIGDAENDISMVRWAGIGAAVANATNELKRVADHVAEKPCTQGVAEILAWCV